jgi:16S rRNA (uracil1498-N3)-methyltransferase
MNRFFIPPESIQEGRVEFPAEASHQITRVLRLRPYERVIVLDNRGMEYEVELEVVQTKGVIGDVRETRQAKGEAQTAVTLYLGLTQREKFEWILQKATEIGAAAFVPLITRRSLVQSAHEVDNKVERWQRIIKEAAEQSRRGLCPELLPVQRIETLQTLNEGQKGFVLWEESQGLGLKKALQAANSRRLALLIGPEGGLNQEEVEYAGKAGFQSVSLGKRILRMETAAIVAAAVTLFELGDMDAEG